MADEETTFEPAVDDHTDTLLKGVCIALVVVAIVGFAVSAFDLSVGDALVSVGLPCALVALAVYVVHMLAKLDKALLDVRRRLAETQSAVRDLAQRNDAPLESED